MCTEDIETQINSSASIVVGIGGAGTNVVTRPGRYSIVVKAYSLERKC